MNRLCAIPLTVAIAAIVVAMCAPATIGADAPRENVAERVATLRERATEQVIAATKDADPFVRANAMEAAQRLPDRAAVLVQLGLEDAQPAVRFAALATMGRLSLKQPIATARRLQGDADPSVRAAALFALRRAGEDVDLTPWAGMLASQDAGLRGNVAMLAGWLGDKSAAPMLKDTARVPLQKIGAAQAAIARMQVAEALVTLGDEASLDAVRAGAYSQHDEVRVLAVQIMGRAGDRRMEKAIEEFVAKPPVELQLAAAEALARWGKQRGLDVALSALDSTTPAVRAQAAMTLGLMKDARVDPALAKSLGDASAQVRVAAAAAVLGR